MHFLIRNGLFVVLLCSCFVAVAQHQGRPLRVIVPYLPGAGTDTLARMMLPFVSEGLGLTVVVDNRPGASSTLGTQLIAQANADGNTIGVVDAAFVTNPSLFQQLPYATPQDFTAIAPLATAPMVLMVNQSVGFKSLQELLSWAKAHPGQLAYGSAGAGSATHLAGEQLRIFAKIELIHVPYKGSAQSMTELVGGHLGMAFTTQGTARAFINSGKLRVLAITSPKRSSLMSDIPTFAELGLPKVDTSSFTGMIGPARLPRSLVQRLNQIVFAAIQSPQLKERYASLGYEENLLSPERYTERLSAEIAKWRLLIRDAGISVTQL